MGNIQKSLDLKTDTCVPVLGSSLSGVETDSVLDPNPKYEVSSELFDPSFFLCKFSNKSTLKVHVKSVKSSVFGCLYLDCLSSKFCAKTTV